MPRSLAKCGLGQHACLRLALATAVVMACVAKTVCARAKGCGWVVTAAFQYAKTNAVVMGSAFTVRANAPRVTVEKIAQRSI